jgi:hypothetical protein
MDLRTVIQVFSACLLYSNVIAQNHQTQLDSLFTRHQTVVLLDNTSSEGLYKSGLNAMNILNDKPLLTIKRSLAKLYGKALMGKSETYAACLLNQYKTDSSHYSLSENDVNNLGYDFLSVLEAE